MTRSLIKICGLRTQADCDAAMGADMCGFIFHAPSPRSVQPELVMALETGAMRRVGVFVTQDGPAILDIVREARLDMVQLHGSQGRNCARLLADRLGREQVIRVLWPARYPDMPGLEADMRLHAPETGLFLLDAGSHGGGSGEVLDWTRLRRSEFASPRPWLLAGGLTPENVCTAVTTCSPDGVDLNSGLESALGHKDPQRIRSALAALRGDS